MTAVPVLLRALSRRLVYGAGIALAVLALLWAVWRHGRAAGRAADAITRAEARIRSLKQAAEVRHDVETDDADAVSRRLERWMRDGDADGL